jgi:hypothetical protein
VHDPHAPSPQPGFAPVKPNSPRNADSNDDVADKDRELPLTSNVTSRASPGASSCLSTIEC